MSLLGMGGLLDQAFDSSTANGIQMDYTQDAAQIVHGTDTTVTGYDSDLLALLDLTGTGIDCGNPVASNVDDARQIYADYVSAKRAFEALEEPDADDRATYNAARMKKDDFDGDVFTTAYDQQARLNAANKAIRDYNKLAGSMGTLATLKTNQGSAGGYDAISVNVTESGGALSGRITAAVPTGDDGNALTGDDLAAALAARVAQVYGSGNTAGFRALASSGAALVATDGTISDTFDGAFNAAGAIQYAVPDRQAGATTTTLARASSSINTFGAITTELQRWQTAVDAAQKMVDAAKKAGNLDTRAEEETLRRATLGRDHVQDELDRLTRVVRSQNLEILEANRVTISTDPDTTDDDVVYDKERDLVDAYLSARGNVVAAAGKVRSAVTNLDNANRALQSKLKDPDSYLNQLVTLRQYQQAAAMAAQEEAGGDDALQSFKDAVTDAGKALAAAREQRMAHQDLTANPESTTSKLLNALLEPEMVGGNDNPADDDGQALLNAISSVDSDVSALKGQLTDAEGNPIDLSNLGNADEIMALTTDVSTNTTDIEGLDGRVAANEGDIDQINMDLDQINTDLYGTTSSQHADASACADGAGGLVNIANCADARSRHNEEDIADLGGDIEALDGRVGDNEDAIAANTKAIESNDMDIAANTAAIESNDMDIAANTMAIESNDMDIAANTAAIESNDMDIAANTMAIESNDMDIAMNAEGIMTNAGNIMTNAEAIVAEASERMGADMMLAGAIEEAVAAGAAADMALSGRIGSNADAIAANMNSIGQNASAISDNRNMIGELSDDLDVVRAGVAASMALAGMPAVNGRGIAIGVGSFDGESAFAVGFQIQGEQASFKVGVTSSGGATGASAGVGFNF